MCWDAIIITPSGASHWTRDSHPSERGGSRCRHAHQGTQATRCGTAGRSHGHNRRYSRSAYRYLTEPKPKRHLTLVYHNLIYLITPPIAKGIQEASSASLEVINELLEFEKLAAGMTTLECVPTRILPFLEQAMKQHLLPARAKEILFELVPSEETRNVIVNVDPCKLTTVFKNIFSNAIKFTKFQGRVTIRVNIKRSSLEGDEMLEIAVVDSGAGLSPANLVRLFGEGVQFNANGLQGGGGSGLGLFITKGQWPVVIHLLTFFSHIVIVKTINMYHVTILFLKL